MPLYVKSTNLGENYFRPHSHNHYEIMAVVRGYGTMYNEDKKYPFSPGSIFVAPPGVVHSVFSEEGHEIINIGGNFEKYLFINDFCAITDNEYGEGTMLAEAIRRNFYINEGHAHSLLKSLISFILLQIDFQSSLSSVISKIISRIEENYDNPEFDVSTLLRDSGYAVDYIRSKFLAVTKMTPVKYLTSVRMKNAKAILSITDLSIGEVAERCGILDVAYFSRLFKKYFGVAPREYKGSL